MENSRPKRPDAPPKKEQLIFGEHILCPNCKGKGHKRGFRCGQCDGRGYIRKE